MYDAFAAVYRAAFEGGGVPARELDATLLWQVGAMLRAPVVTEDADDAAAVEEYVAWREGRGPEPEARAVPMENVIELMGYVRGGRGG